MTVGSSVDFGQMASCGEVSLAVARVGGVLHCFGATFNNERGRALTADQIVVGASMSLTEVSATGEVRLGGAHIGGNLNCDRAIVRNNGGLALDLRGATISRAATFRPTEIDGGLDLRYAQVGEWSDNSKSWSADPQLDGFVYRAVNSSDATFKDRLRSWLPHASYIPQPYEQLASIYRQGGNERAARAVAIEKQRVRRASDRRLWVRLPSRAWSSILRWTIGYGYRPMLALAPLSVLVLAGSMLFASASRDVHLLHPAKPGFAEQPSFNSFRYTLDLLLPVVNFKQRDSFITEGWASWASFTFTFAGWLLALIVVAGIGGVFKRD